MKKKLLNPVYESRITPGDYQGFVCSAGVCMSITFLLLHKQFSCLTRQIHYLTVSVAAD